jgi:hypothetical protein
MKTVKIPEVEDLKVPELEKLIGVGSPRTYTDQDIARIRRYYGKVPLRALAKVLKRNPDAVMKKANSLGIFVGRE